jgi:hypothetical protein
MTSWAQFHANRRNALRSTGPRTRGQKPFSNERGSPRLDGRDGNRCISKILRTPSRSCFYPEDDRKNPTPTKGYWRNNMAWVSDGTEIDPRPLLYQHPMCHSACKIAHTHHSREGHACTRNVPDMEWPIGEPVSPITLGAWERLAAH